MPRPAARSGPRSMDAARSNRVAAASRNARSGPRRLASPRPRTMRPWASWAAGVASSPAASSQAPERSRRFRKRPVSPGDRHLEGAERAPRRGAKGAPAERVRMEHVHLERAGDVLRPGTRPWVRNRPSRCAHRGAGPGQHLEVRTSDPVQGGRVARRPRERTGAPEKPGCRPGRAGRPGRPGGCEWERCTGQRPGSSGPPSGRAAFGPARVVVMGPWCAERLASAVDPAAGPSHRRRNVRDQAARLHGTAACEAPRALTRMAPGCLNRTDGPMTGTPRDDGYVTQSATTRAAMAPARGGLVADRGRPAPRRCDRGSRASPSA